MEQVSASLIVLAGAVVFAAGCVSRSAANEPAILVGSCVGLLGLWVWIQKIGLRAMIESAQSPVDEEP
jgi:hypothetical protein